MERLPVCLQAWGTGEEAMVSVVCSYDDLSRKLWNLKELPLTVTAVQGIHPALRYTDVSVLGHGHAWGSAGSWDEGGLERMSPSLVLWLLRALGAIWCLLLALLTKLYWRALLVWVVCMRGYTLSRGFCSLFSVSGWLFSFRSFLPFL